MTPLASTRDRVGAPRSQLTPGNRETSAAPGGPPSKWHMIGREDGDEVNFGRDVIGGLLARHEFSELRVADGPHEKPGVFPRPGDRNRAARRLPPARTVQASRLAVTESPYPGANRQQSPWMSIVVPVQQAVEPCEVDVTPREHDPNASRGVHRDGLTQYRRQACRAPWLEDKL